MVGIGLILTNAWVFLKWEFARIMAAGPRRIDKTRFRLNRYCRLLIQVIEKHYGTIRAIPTHKSPQSVIY